MTQNLELTQKFMTLNRQITDAQLSRDRKLANKLDKQRIEVLTQLKQDAPRGERTNRPLSTLASLPELEGISTIKAPSRFKVAHQAMLEGYEKLQANPDPGMAHRQLETLDRHLVRAREHNTGQKDDQKRIPVSFFDDLSQIKAKLEAFATAKNPTTAAITAQQNPVAQQANRMASQSRLDVMTARDPRNPVLTGSPVLADSKRIEGLLEQIVQLAREKKRLEALPTSPKSPNNVADVAAQIGEVTRASARLENLAKSSGSIGNGLAIGSQVARATGSNGLANVLAGASRTASAVSTVATVASELPSIATLGGLAALAGPVGLASLAAVGTAAAAGGAAFAGGASGRSEERRFLDLGNQLGQRSRILGDPGRPGVLDASNSLIRPIREQGFNSFQTADFLGGAGALRVKNQAGLAVQGARVARQFGMDLNEVGQFAGAANVTGGRMNDPQMGRVFSLFTASLEEGIARGVGASELTSATKGLLEFSAKQAGGSMTFGAMTDTLGRLQSFQRIDPAFKGASGTETFSKLEAGKSNLSLGMRGAVSQMAQAEAARTGQTIGEIYTGQSRASLKARADKGDESAAKSLKLLDFLNERNKTSPFVAESIAMTEGLPGFNKLFGKSAMRITGGNRDYLRSLAAGMGMSEPELNKLDMSGFGYFTDLATGKGQNARAVSPKGLAGSTQSTNMAGQRALKIETDVNELGMRLSRTVSNLFNPAIEGAVSAVDQFTGALVNGAGSISQALDPSKKGGIVQQGKAGINGFFGNIDRALGIIRPGINAPGFGVDGPHSMARGTVAPNSAFNDPNFTPAVNATAARLGVKPADLLQIMKRESQLDARNRNDKSGAMGLIQFMPNTASSLGTTTDKLAAMTPSQQVAWVEKYLRSVGTKPGSDLGELYLRVHLPALAGKAPGAIGYARDGSGVLSTPALNRLAYAQNIGVDLNKDGRVTKQEITDWVKRDSGQTPSMATPPNQRSPGPMPKPAPYKAYLPSSTLPMLTTALASPRSPWGENATTRYEVSVSIKSDGTNLSDSAVKTIAAAVATKLTPRAVPPKVMPKRFAGINRGKA